MILAGILPIAQAGDDMRVSFDAAESGNFERAVSIWRTLAENGDAQAQFNLGLMYHSGLGMRQSEEEAVRWYHKAAEGGYPPARVYLAAGYEEGWFGLPRDRQKAYYWRGLLEDGQ